MLLESGASVTKENDRGETPVDVVSGAWSEELAGAYRFFAGLLEMELDLAAVERERPEIAKRLREYRAKR